MSTWQYLFSFYGRIGRGRYWFGLLLLWIVMIGIIMLVPIVDGVPFAVAFGDESNYQPGPLAMALLVVISVVGTYIAIRLGVKRCHDRDQSGWWYLLTLFPLLGIIWWFVNLGLLSGTKGPNRFGPDPRDRPAEVFA